MSKSLRKYLRKEKARIRREVLDFHGQEELIKGLYQKYLPTKENDNSGNIQPGDK